MSKQQNKNNTTGELYSEKHRSGSQTDESGYSARPFIIGLTESWCNGLISDSELYLSYSIYNCDCLTSHAGWWCTTLYL